MHAIVSTQIMSKSSGATRVWRLLLTAGYTCSGFVGTLTFYFVCWLITETGPMTPTEHALLGNAYVQTLGAVEATAADLRRSYCDSNDVAAREVEGSPSANLCEPYGHTPSLPINRTPLSASSSTGAASSS